MFENLTKSPICTTMPWDAESVDSRVMNLLAAKGKRVIYLYERPDTSTFRYRVYNMVEAINTYDSSDITAAWFSMLEVDQIMRLLPLIDVLVISRVRYNKALGNIVARSQMLNIPVIGDFDDLVFDIRYAQLIAVTNDYTTHNDEFLDEWYAYIGRLNATAALCQGGITTNPVLAKKLAEIVDGPVKIVPNFLNRKQEKLSRQLLETKKERGFSGDGKITIGYFSGSETHNHDFALAAGALCEIMAENPDVNVRVVGFMSAFDSLNAYADRVERIPLLDPYSLQTKIAEVDINIVPLQQNEFSNCKSELKFFEAAAVGTWTLATQNEVFKAAIKSPIYGTLTENWNWKGNLSAAVEMARDKNKYAKSATRASDYVYGRYGWNQNNQDIISALDRN